MSTLRDYCVLNGPRIFGLGDHNGQPVDGARLLWAIAGLESSWGKTREFARIEPAYSPGGKYHTNSKALQALWTRFGALAACSYGSFQIMFPTAIELGFKGSPVQLQNDADCAFWATNLIQHRFIEHQQAKRLSDIFDAYNSGAVGDRFVPEVYIKTGIQYYEANT